MSFTGRLDGQSRNKMLKHNIVFSGVLKAINLCTSFLIVPVTLRFLDKEPYGIWMTISSMAFWIFTFDIGLGNGMRNYLSAALSREDYKAGKIYISSTFVMLSLIALLMALIALPIILAIDFNDLLSTNSIANKDLQIIILVALTLTLTNFIVKNIGFIYVAMQKYAINDLLTMGGNVLSLIIIYLITMTIDGGKKENLLVVVTVFMSMPILVFLLGGIPLFIKFPAFRPSLKSIDFNFSKGIIQKGLGFFIIQITSCLIIFGGANIFISHFSGPGAVTTYNIAYKYFNFLVIGYTIIIAPMWNAYTDAYVKGDWSWIQKTFKKALSIWTGTVGLGIIMLLGCNLFYSVWVGKSVLIPLSVSAVTLAYISFFNLNSCVTYLLNGLNTIRIQIYTSVIATIIYLVSIGFGGKFMGIEGIVFSMTACYAAMSLIHLYQCKLIIQQKATGIWIK